MEGTEDLVVVRVGHRPGRDDRITTHVGLTARALGADRFVLVGEHGGPLEQIDDVTERFGGPFETEHHESAIRFLRSWPGQIVHLTMYGLPIQDHLEDIRPSLSEAGLTIVVGAEKVPFEIYDLADWNIAVTNQPHSEVASLAVCLDRLLESAALDADRTGGTHEVIPQARGKRVVERQNEE